MTLATTLGSFIASAVATDSWSQDQCKDASTGNLLGGGEGGGGRTMPVPVKIQYCGG